MNQGYPLMVITALTWSGNAVVGRGVAELVPPIGLAFWRWAIALPIFIAIAWPYLRRDLPVALANLPILVFLSVISVSVYNTFVYIGLNTTFAVNAMLIHTGRPVVIVLLSYLIYRRKISALQGIGLVTGLLGTAAIILRGEWNLLAGISLNQGDLWIAAASFGWALYTVFLHKRPQIHQASMMAFAVVIGLAILLPFYLWEAFLVRAVPMAPVSFWSIGYLAVICTVVAYLTYNRTVELLGANRAGLTSYLVLLFGAILAIIFLGEELAAYHGVGGALILAGTYLATRQKQKN
ncbi:MAG: DMT family transporter [Rhodospirillales bacterium]|jgi:drug/metabolite transporter (DMT)-like permease|nr:DMT family transporter [Rhodospirillales bacterium]|tara:strand:+ start:2324 stop:3205 length:882 start_codon:yes stop_codon:yes gene_type:complete